MVKEETKYQFSSFHLVRAKPTVLPLQFFPSLSNIWKSLPDQLHVLLLELGLSFRELSLKITIKHFSRWPSCSWSCKLISATTKHQYRIVVFTLSSPKTLIIDKKASFSFFFHVKIRKKQSQNVPHLPPTLLALLLLTIEQKYRKYTEKDEEKFAVFLSTPTPKTQIS